MPTPFTHLEIAQRLLRDESVPPPVRKLLTAEREAFDFGSVAPDVRVEGSTPRRDTHFYDFGQDLTEHPWRVMVRAHPELMTPHDSAHRVFIAGYVAHLAVDEIWSREMVAPHFALGEWGTDRYFRFYMLQIILSVMDERDLPKLEAWHAESLCRACASGGWLPFASDTLLNHWKDFICQQILPGGVSQTLPIFAERLGKDPADLRALLDSPDDLQRCLWDHVPPDLLADIEAQMYAHARDQVTAYIEETA